MSLGAVNFPTMGDERQQKGGPQAPKASRATDKRADSAAFDTWLERKLHEMFDSVVAEPIPDDLMKVIAKLDRQGESDKK